MPRLIGTLLLLFACCAFTSAKHLGYEEARRAIIEAEAALRTGGRNFLNAKEKLVDEILLKARTQEAEYGFKNPSTFAPGMHFFKAKPYIEQSKVFQFLKKMPKGGILHGHNSAMVSSEWVIKNLTYRPGVLKCINDIGVPVYTFRRQSFHRCTTYIDINEERSRAPDVEAYDKELEKPINMYTPVPETDYPDISAVWIRFQAMFTTISDLILYHSTFHDYHYRLFEEMWEDGSQYIEMRLGINELYDENQEYTKDYTMIELKKVIDQFTASHPGFYGVRLIITSNRRITDQKLESKLNDFRTVFAKFPELVLGFDLVGQEDLGYPLKNFVSQLKTLPPGAQYFFHAGETNWYGSDTDLNLLDAILLDTTRIGHGYALVKHPVLWNAVKTRGIGIEVSPISNQVLNLVWDLRNHPGAFFVSENIPMIICNDDPGFWNAKGISYDFYYGYMSFTPNDAGLSILKQFAWNSIKYSGLSANDKKAAAAVLQNQWDKFLDDVLGGNVI